MIDAIGPERRDALRTLAARIGASDDTAVMAWAAFQTIAGMPESERQQAVALFLGLEEIRRRATGQPAMFSVEKRTVVRVVSR